MADYIAAEYERRELEALAPSTKDRLYREFTRVFQECSLPAIARAADGSLEYMIDGGT